MTGGSFIVFCEEKYFAYISDWRNRPPEVARARPALLAGFSEL